MLPGCQRIDEAQSTIGESEEPQPGGASQILQSDTLLHSMECLLLFACIEAPGLLFPHCELCRAAGPFQTASNCATIPPRSKFFFFLSFFFDKRGALMSDPKGYIMYSHANAHALVD